MINYVASKLKTVATGVPRFLKKHRRELLPILVIVIFKILLHGINFTEFPYYENDEATYAIRSLAFLEDGSFDLYTYWYDHAPAGWIFMAGWFAATGKALLFGSLLNSARFFIFLLSMASAVLVYIIGKRITKERWFATMASLLFIISPLSIFFQRRVLLDNIMVFWALLSLVLLLNKPLKMRHSALSGIAFALAVLTKLNAVFFAPAMLYALFMHTPKKMRTMSIALWAGISGSIMALFPLYALLKGELFSKNANPESGVFDQGISLIDSLTFQSSRGTDLGLSFWEVGSGFRTALDEWASKDALLIFFTALAMVSMFMLISKSVRKKHSMFITVSLMLMGMLLFLARGGVVLEFYFIPVMPFAALVFAAVLAWPLRFKKFQTPSVRNFYKGGLLFCALAIQAPAIVSNLAFTNNENGNLLLALDWIEENVEEDAYIASDNYATLFLNTDGNFQNLHYNFKYEYDPDQRYIINDDWRNLDYILLTHEVLKQMRLGQTPFLREAFEHSVEVASFTEGTTSFNDIEDLVSTNGDWVKIYEVKQDNEIVRQQSFEGFLANHFLDYGRIVDNKDDQVTLSEYQSNSLVRAVEDDQPIWFEGIWAWTQDQLQNRTQDKLISSEWTVDEAGQGSVTNSNSNSLADLEIAYALTVAADKWERPDYKDYADEIIADYWADEVLQINGQLYILPQKIDNLPATITVNPSHAALPYLAYFAQNDTDSGFRWDDLLEDSYSLLADVQDPETGLFPNWVSVTGAGELLSATAFAGESADRFGYEAFRIPFWLNAMQASDIRARELLIPYGIYAGGVYQDTDNIPAVIATDGSTSSTFDDTLLYGSAYPAISLVNPELADQILNDQLIAGGFNENSGVWAREGSNVFNQFWLPRLIHQLEDLRLSAPYPAELAAAESATN